MLRLSRFGARVEATSAEICEASGAFALRRSLQLTNVFDEDLLVQMRTELPRVAFDPRAHEGIGAELTGGETPFGNALEFLLNDPTVFRLVERITSCAPIGRFIARVYEMLPGSAHGFGWHADLGHNRLAALSINLGELPYEGGLFMIRDPRHGRVLNTIANVGVGDAVLFGIADGLEHCVTPVKGTVPKTAYSGWFQSEPRFIDLVRRKSNKG